MKQVMVWSEGVEAPQDCLSAWMGTNDVGVRNNAVALPTRRPQGLLVLKY